MIQTPRRLSHHSESRGVEPSGAERLECVELAPAFNHLRPSTAGASSCTLYASLAMVVRARIPKGFRQKAQGCEERATLGVQWRGGAYPQKGGGPTFFLPRQEKGATTPFWSDHSF